VRAELDRLGPPEEIVRAEEPDAAPAAAPQPRGIVHEALAAVFLTVGSFVPVVGWLLGAVLLWTSKVWTVREKVVGTLLIPGGPAVAAVFGLGITTFAVTTCTTTTTAVSASHTSTVEPATVSDCPTGPNWAGIGVLVVAAVAFVVPFVVAGVLLRRAYLRTRG
jgi:hypothetical protein